MAGGGKGRVPSTSDRSEWQTPEAPMRRTTSRGPGGSGSTSSTEMGASTPTNTAAFMDLASWSGDGSDGVAQVAGEHVVVVEFTRLAAEGDLALVEHVHVVGHGQGPGHVLLDQQQRRARLGQAVEELEDLVDDLGGQAHRHLVEEDDRRVRQVGPGEGQHLLLAAGERPG